MKEKYTGTLSLEWYNKQKTILMRSENNAKESDVPAPFINWINKEESLFYETLNEEGKGLKPFWVDKNDIRVKEARPFVLQKTIKAVKSDKPGTIPGTNQFWEVIESNEEDNSIDNILVKGDNLLALKTLKKMFIGKNEIEKAKCIYIDPPYNTGAAFDHYDDNLEHSEWMTLFRDRVVALKDLLQEGGYIFVQLDDSEGPYGKIILDEIFGVHNFVITMYVQVRYNDKTLKEDAKFNKLIEQVFIYTKNTELQSGLKREKVEYTNEKFCVKINELKEPSETLTLGGKKVEVFKEGGYEIKVVESSKKGLKEIWASGSILDGNSSGRFFRDYITGREKIDGVKTMYKVYDIGDDGIGYRYFTGPMKITANRGKYFQGMPLDKQKNDENFKFVPISNFIDLSAQFGNCRHEGGVEFKSGKKPEILISKLFELATSPGDLIIDCFGGSGTSFGVAHKMGRRWIGIEMGNQADTHILKRMKNVISGNDQTGISKEFEWKGGGGFKYFHLGESIIVIRNDGSVEFNWSLGKDFIEESFLLSYDYEIIKDFSLNEDKLFKDDIDTPKVGIQKIGNKTRIAIINLCSPDSDNIMLKYDELHGMYKKIMDKYKPEFINVFTNKGVEIAFETKPEKLEVIKVPTAIYSAND